MITLPRGGGGATTLALELSNLVVALTTGGAILLGSIMFKWWTDLERVVLKFPALMSL